MRSVRLLKPSYFNALQTWGEKAKLEKEYRARKEGEKKHLYRCWPEDPEEGLFPYDEG